MVHGTIKKEEAVLVAIEAGAEGLRWVVSIMTGFGYRNVVVESDSQVLVRMNRGEEDIWPILKPIIQDINHSLIAFPAYVISYYPRKGNKAAGKIVNETFSFMNNVPKPSCILLVPPWVKSFMEADKPCVRMS